MSDAPILVDRRMRRRKAKRTVEERHDTLQVTDRVWHHIDFTKPLVVEMVDELLEAQPAPARVLLIGCDSLSAYTLEDLGYDITLWHFAEGYLTDDLLERVDRIVSPEALSGNGELRSEPRFDAVVVPLILESLPANAVEFLSSLRRILAPSGTVILATTNARRLDLRLLTLLGRDTTAAFPKFHVSFSFPPLPRLRYYQADELERTLKLAGLRSRRRRYVLSHAAYSDIDPHPPARFLKLILSQWLMKLLPSTRPAILLSLSHRVGEDRQPDPSQTYSKAISVILSARRGEEDLRRSLGALLNQAFDPDDYEVIVLHDGQVAERSQWIKKLCEKSSVEVREFVHDPAEGPVARNAASQFARGTICAHTDDGCRISLGWLPTIAGSMDDAAVVVSGPVVDEPGSHPPFLTLPGSRPGWDHHGLYPISNVAYRRAPFLACGGFLAPRGRKDSVPLLWDTELAWRLDRMGWNSRYLKHMFMYRYYPAPQRLRWFGSQWRLARDLPQGVKRAPGLRRQLLTANSFASHTTLYFDLLVIGIVAALVAQTWWPMALAFPYVAYYSRYFDVWPPSQWRPSVRLIAGASLRHFIWLSGLLWGSFRARRVVL